MKHLSEEVLIAIGLIIVLFFVVLLLFFVRALGTHSLNECKLYDH